MLALRRQLGDLKARNRWKRCLSFSEAASGRLGYDDRRVAELVARRTANYRAWLATTPPIPSGYRVEGLLALLTMSNGSPLDVLEIGGACGAAYLEAKTWLPGRVRRWHVVETSAMLEAGRAFEDESLNFFSDIDTAVEGISGKAVGVVSGTLQYIERGLETLTHVAAHTGDMWISRTPLVEKSNESVYLRQKTCLVDHGPGSVPAGTPRADVYLPMVVRPHEEFVGHLSAIGDLTMTFADEHRYPVGGHEIREYGFVVVRR